MNINEDLDKYQKELEMRQNKEKEKFLNKKCPACLFIRGFFMLGTGFFMQAYIYNNKSELYLNNNKNMLRVMISVSIVSYYLAYYNIKQLYSDIYY